MCKTVQPLITEKTLSRAVTQNNISHAGKYCENNDEQQEWVSVIHFSLTGFLITINSIPHRLGYQWLLVRHSPSVNLLCGRNTTPSAFAAS
jgi:hypothetical protein